MELGKLGLRMRRRQSRRPAQVISGDGRRSTVPISSALQVWTNSMSAPAFLKARRGQSRRGRDAPHWCGR